MVPKRSAPEMTVSFPTSPLERLVEPTAVPTRGVQSVTRKQTTQQKNMASAGRVGKRGTGVSSVLRNLERPKPIKEAKQLCLLVLKLCRRWRSVAKLGWRSKEI